LLKLSSNVNELKPLHGGTAAFLKGGDGVGFQDTPRTSTTSFTLGRGVIDEAD
jgi:hypothetical protein